MKQTIKNYNSADSIATNINLRWLNESMLKQSKRSIITDGLTNNLPLLKKLMYEGWCKAKLKARERE